jgi:phage terminase large subunit-like protein
MLEEIAVAEGSLSKRAEFLTKYCNIKQSSSTAWLEFQTVEKCLSERIDPSALAHHYCVGGVDLSQAIDLTSACVVIEDKGRLYVIQHYWMPHERLEKAIEEDGVPYRQLIQKGFISLSGENYVDYNDVFEWFRNLVEQYEILPLQVGYDKWCATYFVDQMTKYGFHMDDVRQGSNLTPVIREVDGLLKDGVVCIGDNTLTQAHFLNSALKQEDDRVRLVKISKRARIDGMAAFLDAMTVRQKHYADIGAQLKNEG